LLVASQTVIGEKSFACGVRSISKLATECAVASQNAISKKVCRSEEQLTAKATEPPTRK
jgi:hypothetical protein